VVAEIFVFVFCRRRKASSSPAWEGGGFGMTFLRVRVRDDNFAPIVACSPMESSRNSKPAPFEKRKGCGTRSRDDNFAYSVREGYE
jgi:hypothetical protein